ncbi:hypothetical protein A3H22_00970 [Candidatus Peribacteria bacterium RIFCSPLOWO2_12_FULL_55_15]|nr:MAG: hypothetical protein A2789_00730 [Candidatus Peribacteria bacterium RIFCSPHIGHO2_01_FULL_54_22]OGJ63583.1 MAG: hypothetical protein A3D12_04010 [Candidatus Peribacteria bacterium RIFCSPHIGHO2_02_FULL_55_24]OGJ68870.1 MAG: hypothetical protein A2947_03765 [Candidatus Peribacteria bacterium RIFCSPLOWO2_01_FULL_54_110]OGJ69575.1 MAG: hypothetical protein A3H90_02910 [Candidatus Peribacteria bacterium RIFCSPLOWO2_02_FULL_55_36]OGJ70220.1 MAG: hypothetical protein A3H22_00970 [Candidatus Per
MDGLLVLIIGPSGVGKTVLTRMLLERHPQWTLARSATTRPRRPGESDVFYRFVTREEFTALAEEGAFLEWATVHNGARYGTLRDEIIPALDDGKTVLREVDVQGLASIRHHPLFRRPGGRHRHRAIFIAPESPEQLVAHIHKRAPMTEEELQRRLASVTKEMTFAAQCDATVVSREGELAAAADILEKEIRGTTL